MFLRRHHLLFSLLAIIALLATACGGDDNETPSAEAATPVSLQLGWTHNMEYSGFYVAKAQGFYREANLDVEILEGGFDADGNFISPDAQVISGNADFGIMSGDQLLVARAGGAPLVAIATIYQRSPIVFVSLLEKNITRPQEFAGKSAAITRETSTGLAFYTLLGATGIDPADMDIVPRTGASKDQMLSGEVDLISEFITNDPFASEPERFNMVLASDYGIDMYSNVIITTEDTIANRPELVEAFLRQSVRGFEEALNSPEGATDEILKLEPEMDRDQQLASMLATVPLVRPAGSSIGMMQSSIWDFTHQSLLDEGTLEAALDFESAFTLDFIRKVHNQS